MLRQWLRRRRAAREARCWATKVKVGEAHSRMMNLLWSAAYEFALYREASKDMEAAIKRMHAACPWEEWELLEVTD